MKIRTFVLVALASASLAACGSPQKPVTFLTSARVETAIDTVSRALAAEGQTPAVVDRQSNVVHTEWQDTGFLYGQVQGSSATIVRRFTATIAPTAQGTNVVVRMDVKRCPRGGYSVGNVEVRGLCEQIDLVPQRLQTELDTLGRKVREALQSAPSASKG